jgi:hypothetical protein
MEPKRHLVTEDRPFQTIWYVTARQPGGNLLDGSGFEQYIPNGL